MKPREWTRIQLANESRLSPSRSSYVSCGFIAAIRTMTARRRYIISGEQRCIVLRRRGFFFFNTRHVTATQEYIPCFAKTKKIASAKVKSFESADERERDKRTSSLINFNVCFVTWIFLIIIFAIFIYYVIADCPVIVLFLVTLGCNEAKIGLSIGAIVETCGVTRWKKNRSKFRSLPR